MDIIGVFTLVVVKPPVINCYCIVNMKTSAQKFINLFIFSVIIIDYYKYSIPIKVATGIMAVVLIPAVKGIPAIAAANTGKVNFDTVFIL